MYLHMFEIQAFFIFLAILILIALVLLFLSFSLIYQDPTSEKVSAYECGFQPFSDARALFEVRFYLIGILFIIFDLEIIFLFPWVYYSGILGGFSWVSFFLFMFILLIGFFVEWHKGALEWD